MGSKGLTDDAEKDRVREEARALINEARERRAGRDLHQTVCGIHEWLARPDVCPAERDNFFRRGQDHWEETRTDTDLVAREITIPWLPGVRVRLTGRAPYYINRQP